MSTGQERELDTKLPYFWFIRWCPDGQSILATDFEKDLPQVVYKIDVETGKHSTLVRSEKERIVRAELTPDEKNIFYESQYRSDGSAPRVMRLTVRNLETGGEKEILRATYPPFLQLRRWNLSPDGKRVAARILDEKGSILKIISTTDGECRDLLRKDDPRIDDIAWTPDGKNVLFTLGNDLWRISADGGEPRKLQTWKERSLGLRVHPDGQTIAYFTGESKYEVWVMENFLPAGE